MGDLIRKDELETAVEARRELGPEYEDQVLDAFMAKVEQRLDQRLEAARRPAKPNPNTLPIALGSIGMAIPITAIAGGTAGLGGIIIAWLGIAIVNVAAALSGRRR